MWADVVIPFQCLGWWGLSCFGLHCIPNLLQRHDVRTRSVPNLSGNFVTDFLKVCGPHTSWPLHPHIGFIVGLTNLAGVVLLLLRSHPAG